MDGPAVTQEWRLGGVLVWGEVLGLAAASGQDAEGGQQQGSDAMPEHWEESCRSGKTPRTRIFGERFAFAFAAARRGVAANEDSAVGQSRAARPG